MTGDWSDEVKSRLEQQCNDFNPHGADIRAVLERVEELERDRDSLRQDRDAFSENLSIAQRHLTIAVAGEGLYEQLLAAEKRVEELEREKYGTPCKCEQWVKACGEAEQRAEAAEAKLAKVVEVRKTLHAKADHECAALRQRVEEVSRWRDAEARSASTREEALRERVEELERALDDMMLCPGDSRPSVRIGRGAYERAQRILAAAKGGE